jgi:uncharacterized protein YutE (UPF0331/DUF86 family)
VAVVVLRNELRRVLLTLTRLRYKDLEVDFGRELKEVEKRAKAIDVKPARQRREALAVPKDSIQRLDEAERLAADFPEPAVALAWSAVEDELMNAVMRLAVSPDNPPLNSALQNARLLRDSAAIDDGMFDILNRMRKLRNVAVHGGAGPGGVTADEAREFIALARGVVEKLRGLRKE